MSAARHRWDYGGSEPRFARHRTCIKCGLRGRTFGSGGWRVWDYTTATGKFLGTSAGPCPGRTGE